MLGSSEFSVPAPLVNLKNMQITTSGANTDLCFVFLGYVYPLGDEEGGEEESEDSEEDVPLAQLKRKGARVSGITRN